MPQSYLYETAVTIDHDADECRVDTTVRGVASMCLRARFLEVTKPNSAPYRRFIGLADQFRLRGPKGSRPVRKKVSNLPPDFASRLRSAGQKTGSPRPKSTAAE